MNMSRAAAFDRCIADLAQADPILAFSKVPIGINTYWGETLGWPEWLLEGTSYAVTDVLPREVSLLDDLRMLANLVCHEGEERLTRMLLDWPHYPSEALVLAAPDMRSAMTLIAKLTNRRNLHISMSYREDDDKSQIEVNFSPLLGPFLPLHESIVLTVLALCARSFIGVKKNGLHDLARIEIGASKSSDLLSRFLPCKVSKAEGGTYLSVPSDLAGRRGLAHDRDLWQRFLLLDTVKETYAIVGSSTGVEAIEAAIISSLREEGRIPQLAEIASLQKVSTRTLSRQLSRAGISYREIVDATRMKVAKEMLLDGNYLLAELSAQLGYSDVSAFVRAFRRRFAASPARWRRAQRGNMATRVRIEA